MNILKKLFSADKYKFCVSCCKKINERDFYISDLSAGICNECSKKIYRTKWGSSFEAKPPIQYILSPFEYCGSIAAILRGLKFRSSFKNGDILCRELKRFLENYGQLTDFDYVIPIPLSAQRLKERGFNQSEIFAKCISGELNIPLNLSAVSRVRNTHRQASLSAAERVINVKDAFSANGSLENKRLILVDDIYTTGNTMASCAKALKSAGAGEIAGITLAISVRSKHEYFLYTKSKQSLKCKNIRRLIRNFKYKS